MLNGGHGLSDERYAAAAGRFADPYAAFDPARQREAMLHRAEEVLAQIRSRCFA